jgi:hypothetical protein
LRHPVVELAQVAELDLDRTLALLAPLLEAVDAMVRHEDLHSEVERIAQELDVVDLEG